MTPRERAAAVYEGRVPDQVPLFLDISHWYKKNYNVPFDLTGLQTVDETLVKLHRELNAVAYVEMGRFYDLTFEEETVRRRVPLSDPEPGHLSSLSEGRHAVRGHTGGLQTWRRALRKDALLRRRP